MANHNYGRFLSDCLDSVLDQAFQDLEIIIADDGSTDNSLRIIREYVKKYPEKVRATSLPISKGAARARHLALLQSRSPYWTTLDSDDYYYHREKLAREMDLVLHSKSQHGRDIIAFSNIVLVNEDGTLKGYMENSFPVKEGFLFKEILGRECLIPRDFVVKKDAYFEVGGYDFQFPLYEDWDLKIRLARRFEFRYTGIPGTAYRQHGQGLSSLPIENNIFWLEKVFYKNWPLADPSQKANVQEKINEFINQARSQHKMKEIS